MTYIADLQRRRRRQRQRRFSLPNSRIRRHLTHRKLLTMRCLRGYTHLKVSNLVNLTLDKEIARHD